MDSDLATRLEKDAVDQMFVRLIQAEAEPLNGNEAIARDLAGAHLFEEAFCCNDPIYEAQIRRLQTSAPTKVMDGTVGAYLYGCFINSPAVEVACTPDCVYGISNPNLPPCELSSYQKRAQKLTRLNLKATEDANIFIQTGEYLTPEDHAQLFLDGVRVITIFHQIQSSIDYSLGQSMVVMPTHLSDATNSESVTTTSNTDPTSDQAWWWWGLVVLILVIFMIIAVMY